MATASITSSPESPAAPLPGSPGDAIEPGLSSLQRLVSPLGGLISRVSRLPSTPGGADFAVCTAQLGDVSHALPLVRESAGGRSTRNDLDGAGGDLSHSRAALISAAEALERYSSCAARSETMIWASAESLGDEALDLSSVPRFSARELSHPLATVAEPDERAPIRWVRGFSLTDRRQRWIPAVMTYLHIAPRGRAECFTMPISTGCAAHTDLCVAIGNALCEVIERDAISVLWHQQLALPRIEIDELPADAEPFLDRLRRSDVAVDFFDATTDVGVPVVYSVERTPHDPQLATLVMCASALDPARAVAKVLREGCSSRLALSITRETPPDPRMFYNVYDGASYMGAAERAHAFDFLVHSSRQTRLSDLPRLAHADARENLRVILARLAAVGAEAFVVDLSTDEARRAGFWVVRVIVPKLQPLSFVTIAQYRGHPRLYEAPVAMGYPSRTEEELNPWPQPFA